MWLDDTLAMLAKDPVCGYAPGTPATEPTALAALALIVHGRKAQAQPAAEFLLRCQAPNGSVGVREGEPTPGWPTSLAVLAWKQTDQVTFRAMIDLGIEWLLSIKGKAMPDRGVSGHNTLLVAWPWAEGTHSWIEPTALAVLALKATGQAQNDRTREAVAMLLDRQLPDGGCNYGNTTVLGQMLRPHVLPTGIALLALAGERDALGNIDRRVDISAAWLQSAIDAKTTPASLAWGLLGLAAHGIEHDGSDELLARSYQKVQAHDRSPYKLVLLALAAAAKRLPLTAKAAP